jgi:hypothetical protein
MNVVFPDLKNPTFDIIYDPYINQWHMNHIMYNTTDNSIMYSQIENTQTQISIVSVLHNCSSRYNTFQNMVRENSQP